MDDCPPLTGYQGSLACAGFAVAVAVATRLIDVGFVVGMLDAGDAVAAAREFGDEL